MTTDRLLRNAARLPTAGKAGEVTQLARRASGLALLIRIDENPISFLAAIGRNPAAWLAAARWNPTLATRLKAELDRAEADEQEEAAGEAEYARLHPRLEMSDEDAIAWQEQVDRDADAELVELATLCDKLFAESASELDETLLILH